MVELIKNAASVIKSRMAVVLLLVCFGCSFKQAFFRKEYIRDKADFFWDDPDLGAENIPIIYGDSGLYVLSVGGVMHFDYTISFAPDGKCVYCTRNYGVYKEVDDTLVVNEYYYDDVFKYKFVLVDSLTLRCFNKSTRYANGEEPVYYRYVKFNAPIKFGDNKQIYNSWTWRDINNYRKWYEVHKNGCPYN